MTDGTVVSTRNFPENPRQVRKVHTVGSDTRTEVYVHTYDQAERLLKTTCQLGNAAAVTLVNNTYDEVGHLKSDSRNGNAKLKTEYAYNVRSWTKSITGTLFSQTLNYQEAITGNTPCYNGNISSMLWKAGSETSPRGYRFTYDGLSRLKDALYGEGATLVANTDRFNEQVTGYDKMGNILGLKRYGQTAASTYGLIDHLALTYNGNRLQAVKDAATNSVYGNGTEFKDGSNQTTEYTYDKNGNLTKDLNKDISKIGYNLLNLPDEVTFANGNSIRYEYVADGTKLRTMHKTGATTLTTDYCGNAVYENGVLKMLLNEAGYVSFSDRKFHFYLKDHQGNVRVVADKDGNVEEMNAYYPFGGTFTSTNSVQPYKYNGKELDAKNGLNWYEYGARQYDAAIGRWHAIVQKCEKYNYLSLYVYVFIFTPFGHKKEGAKKQFLRS
ncbi:RHS repeat domain-containing protein [Bacteroides bouchesdurhonensis]|uniref:RHS repeat domain-containing protein n=1 Tax=Bacteroides bouchesdurhonensis TaxID=1841855 RepID=UPI001651C3D6|nr:RHS repeat-associated core domain-containing protein [Bacteroides bouchesdurhonensis]